jgi:hypothetical protein
MNKSKTVLSTFILAVLLVWFTGIAPATECGTAVTDPIADEMIGSSGITWSPKISYARLVLSVASPSGEVIEKNFESGSTPYLDFSSFTNGIVDGTYTYELRVIPTIGKTVRKGRALDHSGQEGLPQKAMTQTGNFRVEGGMIVSNTGNETISRPMDILQYDDVIITGSLCIGFDCANGEAFGYCTMKLKENNLQLCFEDTSIGTFPTNDWKIQINDTTSGGASYFTIWDTDGGRRPFTLEAGAPAHSLYVEDYGRVGLGTSIPYVELHIVDGDSPTIRLDQDGSSGWAAQRWDMCGNETNFFIRDVTNGSTLPFRMQPGVPSNTLCMRADGKVGIGTWSPEYPLELECTGTNATFSIDRTDGATAKITGGASGVQFGSQSNHQVKIVVNNSTSAITISNTAKVGIGNTSPSHLLDVGTSGAYCNGGAWIDGSSRQYKEKIRSLSAEQASDTLAKLNPVRFYYKGDNTEESLGFIAEDVPELVATKDRKGMSAMDVVAVLTKVVQEQQETIAELKKKVEALEKK